MVDGHEESVDDDAECDEEVDERVHDEQLDVRRERLPTGAALVIVVHLHAFGLDVLAPWHGFFVRDKTCFNIAHKTHPYVYTTTKYRFLLLIIFCICFYSFSLSGGLDQSQFY